MNTLLAQLVATEERLSRLQRQLAVKRAVVHEAATLLRVGADPAVVARGSCGWCRRSWRITVARRD